MSAFTGVCGPGAMARLRERRRAEAAGRDARTAWDRRKRAHMIVYTDGCVDGLTTDGELMAHSHSADHEPGAAHVPWMRQRYSRDAFDALTEEAW